MAGVFYQYEHLMVTASYRTPEPHSHLASHLILGTGECIDCQIEHTSVRAKAICIASDIEHTVCAKEGEMLVFLFDETSKMAKMLEERYLKGEKYAVLSDELTRELLVLRQTCQENPAILDKMILDTCGIRECGTSIRDERIQRVMELLKEYDTISPDVVGKLSKELCLSKSRLSHLFKENAGISLRRYLAFEKMRKGSEYYQKTGNITEASMLAGFDSPSHYAATCKRMFGISFSEFVKSTG